MLVNPNDGSIDDRVLEVGILRQGLENLLEHAAFGPSTKSLKALFANRVDMLQNGGNAGDRDDGPEGISGLAERG